VNNNIEDLFDLGLEFMAFRAGCFHRYQDGWKN
jgi:hypothetical protein